MSVGRFLITLCMAIVLFSAPLFAQSDPIPIPADSPRWDLQGQASVVEHGGRMSLALDGGAAVLKDFEMRDGVVDVDFPAARGMVAERHEAAAIVIASEVQHDRP